MKFDNLTTSDVGTYDCAFYYGTATINGGTREANTGTEGGYLLATGTTNSDITSVTSVSEGTYMMISQLGVRFIYSHSGSI